MTSIEQILGKKNISYKCFRKQHRWCKGSSGHYETKQKCDCYCHYKILLRDIEDESIN